MSDLDMDKCVDNNLSISFIKNMNHSNYVRGGNSG